MRVLRGLVATTLLVAASPLPPYAQAPQPTAPAGQTPAPQTPGAPGQPSAAPAAAPVPVPRTFTAPVGLLFNTVRADRVKDFERMLASLQTALEKSTDPTIQAQAKGWRIFKATEPGPNSTVLYVFQFDPVVPGADYSLGRILGDAYPDAAQLQEIWKLYQDSVTSGGSLLNLMPVMPGEPQPPGTTPARQ